MTVAATGEVSWGQILEGLSVRLRNVAFRKYLPWVGAGVGGQMDPGMARWRSR